MFHQRSYEDIRNDWGYWYSHLFISDVKINNEFESSQAALAATLTGEYEASVDIFSAQATWKF